MLRMKNSINLETKRTYLRCLSVDDAENFYQLNLDKEVIKYTGDKPFYDVYEAETFLNEYDQYEKYGVGRLAVIEKEKNKFLGWCGLKYDPIKNEYDIGFRFFRANWNKGYATETASACLDFGFQKMGIERILGRAMKLNVASIKVLQKIGLKYVGDFELDLHDGVLYELMKNQYEKLKSFNESHAIEGSIQSNSSGSENRINR